ASRSSRAASGRSTLACGASASIVCVKIGEGVGSGTIGLPRPAPHKSNLDAVALFQFLAGGPLQLPVAATVGGSCGGQEGGCRLQGRLVVGFLRHRSPRGSGFISLPLPRSFGRQAVSERRRARKKSRNSGRFGLCGKSENIRSKEPNTFVRSAQSSSGGRAA